MAVRAIDYETNGLNYWEDSFKVVSMAVSWRDEHGIIKNWFTTDRQQMVATLNRMGKLGDEIIAHNLSFEYGVTITQFKNEVDLAKLNWHADTARMVQLFDNGGPGDEKKARFGLDQCVIRVLPKDCWSHKKEADQWIKANVRIPAIKKRKYGRKIPWTVYRTKPRVPKKKEIPSFRDRLPIDILERYNKLDTDNTLKIYDVVAGFFLSRDIDWRVDHEYYLSVTKQITDATITGIKVKPSRLRKNIDLLTEKVEGIDVAFRSMFATKLADIEAAQGKPFNMNSKKQLATLFMDKVGIQPTLLTKKGGPSFKAAHMAQWGEGGKLIKDRGKYLKVVEHCNKLLVMSQYDGRWHAGLRTTGTSTGRLAGAGGLNIQGLARRNKGLMSALIADNSDRIFVSQDLSSGEPTCTTHYSRDAMYKAATFDMVGKKPYWKNDVLMISDIYLMTMSVSPISKYVLLEAWNRDWEGLTFAEQWMKDSEVVKDYLKTERAFCKMLCLGLSYGMGAKKLARSAFEFGRPIDLKTAKAFHRAYWALFAGVRVFSDKCGAVIEKTGFLINAFGYVNVPEPHKAFNAFIQSTVSGIINYYLMGMLEEAPWAKLVTIIHDEVIYDCPVDRLEDLKKAQEKVLTNLNAVLNWSVGIRMGFQEGANLYEAK